MKHGVGIEHDVRPLADFAPRCSYPPSLGPVASGVDY